MKNISIFYDGQHLKLALAHYHDTLHKTLDLSALHQYIGRKADGRVISARAYYGRSAPDQLDERHLREDRFFDTLLAKAGIIPHVLPVNSVGAEKGVDVWLALDLFEHVNSTQCDVVVLVSGDADYVPLLRKLKITETKSMVLGWNLPDTTNVAQALLREADQALALEAVLKHPREGAGLLISSAAFAGNTGVITRVSEGYGFIAPRMGGPELFFHHSDLKNRRFAAVQVGDAVEFELGKNRSGECAKRVRVV